MSALSYQNRTLSYSLVSNPHNLFTIHHMSGEISMTKSMDYETEPHQFLLLVRASEDHRSLTSTAEVGTKYMLGIMSTETLLVNHILYSEVILYVLFPYSLPLRSHFLLWCCYWHV